MTGSASSPSPAGATSWPPSRWTAARSACTWTRSIPIWRAKAASDLSSVLAQGSQLLGATTDPADRVLVIFTDGEAHDTLPDIVAQAEAAQGGGRAPHHGRRGRAGTDPDPAARLGRDAARVQAGRRGQGDPDPSGATTSCERWWMPPKARWCPSDAPRPGGRGARSGRRDEAEPDLGHADGRPRAARVDSRRWSRRSCCSHTRSPGRGRRSSASRALLLAAPRAVRSGPPPGARALAAGDPTRAAAEFLKEASSGQRRRTRRSTTPAPRRSQAGRLDVARGALAEAAKSLDPGLRYRALYNLGARGAARRAGRHGAPRRAARRRQPTACAQALLLQPASERAKWNLELAERRRPPHRHRAEVAARGAPPPKRRAAISRQPPAAQPEPGTLTEARRSRSSTRWSAASERPARSSSAECRTARPAE